MALQREHGRTHEQLEADERGDRVSGQPEDQRRASDAERDRLARFDRHAPEDLLDAELGLDPTAKTFGPTDPPPDVTRTSAARTRPKASRGAAPVTATPPQRPGKAPAHPSRAAGVH